MVSQQERCKILVAGGGITGLSAAFYAAGLAAERGLAAEIILAERSGRLGGKIRTLRKDGFVIEKGPDSFLARKLPIIELSRELGLEEQLEAMNPQARKTYIVRGGRLHPMPAGLILGIPTQREPFQQTELISPRGKLRAALDLIMPPRRGTEDESLGDFLERRLGREVLEQIVEPLLAGIYAGDTRKLSLMATYPQFREAERKYGSLIRGTAISRKQAPQAGAPGGLPAVARGSQFLTYRNGLATLVETLEKALLARGVRILCNTEIAGIEAVTENSAPAGIRVRFGRGEPERYDAFISALPAFSVSRLFPQLPAVARLKDIEYVSVANVILAFHRRDLERELDGSGFLVPRTEGRFITACTWTSRKWLHTAPEGKALLRCYVGRSGQEDWVSMEDEEIVAKVRRDMRELAGITADPLFYEITRLPHSMPQYPVGHLERVQAARDELDQAMPGTVIAGAGFHGVGLPDCIRQGREAAEHALRRLASIPVH
jgi:oxygen-dependent protoporphyrinogen oxidase